MPDLQPLPALHAGPSASVSVQALEQVMRSCGDELMALPFLDVEAGSRRAASALGRLLTEHPLRLVAGCPLIALVSGAPVDPLWRDACPAAERSLWAELDFLRQLLGASVESPDLLGELELLRQRSAAEFTQD